MPPSHPNQLSLADIPAFAHLNAAVIAALESISIRYPLRAGEVLYHVGTEARAFYVVLAGGLRLLEYTPGGTRVSLKLYGPGELFGLLAISGPYAHPSEVQALCASQVLAINGSDTRHLMERFPALSLTVLDLLVTHIHRAHARVWQMGAERVEIRLARALIQLVEKFGQPDGDAITIAAPISQRDLAEFTATTVESVNRTLRTWKEAGILTWTRQNLDINDLAALHDLLEAEAAAH